MNASERQQVEADAVEAFAAILRDHPEIRERTARLLVANPSPAELHALQPGRHDSTPRKRRLRERRRQAGWQNYLIWLSPEGQAAMQALRHDGETTDAFFNRALVTLQALSESSPEPSPDLSSHGEAVDGGPHLEMSPVQRKALLTKRLRELKAQGLTLQAIANQLNQEGVPTISGKGTWKKGTIGNLLAEDLGAHGT